jgi:hypothetical protein
MSSSAESAFSYVLPIRISASDHLAASRLTGYLRELHGWCDDVIVVDGSPDQRHQANRCEWEGVGRHVALDQARSCLNGKVAGVLTGIDLARHERVVIADDDVRYDRAGLQRTIGLLGDHDLVRPQNYFWPQPWHAVWDTARTLLNRGTIGADFPGTVAVRRSVVQRTGGYDGNVLFENLELIRTVRAHGGVIASPLDLYVRRLPPTTRHFLGQRVRQAYDEFALPLRMALWLSIVPYLWRIWLRRRLKLASMTAATTLVLAERGRRRAHGQDVFPAAATALAPLWIIERACCAWLAVAQRVRHGGVRYGNSVIRVAANSEGTLRRRGRASADT